MAKGRAAVEVTTILQIVVAAFLITLGLIGIIHYNSDLAQFGRGMNKLFGRGNGPMGLIGTDAICAEQFPHLTSPLLSDYDFYLWPTSRLSFNQWS